MIGLYPFFEASPPPGKFWISILRKTDSTHLIVGRPDSLGEFTALGRAEIEEAPEQVSVQDVSVNVLQLLLLNVNLSGRS